MNTAERPVSALRARLGVVAAMVVVLLAALPALAQPFTAADARCRKALHGGMQRLANTIVKEQVRCHQVRIRENIPPSVDCNDPANFLSPQRVANAEQVVLRAAKRCADAAPPAALGFGACPAPCGALPVATHADVAACFACVARATAVGMVEDVFGLPTYGVTDRLDRLCQAHVGQVLREYMSARMRQQAHCQYLQDRETIDESVDCVTADLRGVVFGERFAARQVIAACSTDDIVDAQLCGTDVPSLTACVEAAVEGAADGLFAVGYP